jgi:hypothetical protein
MRSPAWTMVWLAAWAGVASGQTTVNPKLAKAPDSKVCLLPLEASLTKAGMKGGEGMIKESEEWAVKMSAMIRKAFMASGAAIIADYSEGQPPPEENVRQVVVQLEQKYDGISVQLRKRPGDVRKGRFSLGDDVALLPCAAQAEFLVFAQARGTLLTGSRKVVGFMIGGVMSLASTRSDLWLSLVDAKSGEVAAFTHLELVAREKFATKPEEAYGKYLQRELAKMHVGEIRAE